MQRYVLAQYKGVFLMPSQEANSYAEQNRYKLVELLHSFLDTHHLSLEELAGLLRLSPLILEEWFRRGMGAPSAFLALAVLCDAERETARRAGYGSRPWLRRCAEQDDYMLRMVRAI